MPEYLELNTGRDELRAGWNDAVENATDQDRPTVLTEDGKPVAALVPWGLYEHYQKLTGGVMS